MHSAELRPGDSGFVLSQATPDNVEALREWEKAGDALAALRQWAEGGHVEALAALDAAVPALERVQSALVAVGR